MCRLTEHLFEALGTLTMRVNIIYVKTRFRQDTGGIASIVCPQGL